MTCFFTCLCEGSEATATIPPEKVPIGDSPSTKNAVASRWLATAFFRLIPESFKYADYAGNQFYLIVGHPIACKGA